MAKKGESLSEETKRKISESGKGRVVSEETRQKIGNAHKGMKHSEETRQKMSESGKGRKPSEETRRKLSEWQKGKKLSEEHRQKLSESRTGKKRKPHTEEAKAKMRESAFAYAAKIGHFTVPKIGSNEKQILDNLEQELDYRIIRQFKVGGYFLDGYIPEINLAIEVDEKHHEYQTEKDRKREDFITAKLGCEFLRIKDY